MFGFNKAKYKTDDWFAIKVADKLKGKAWTFSHEIYPAFKALNIIWDTIGVDHRSGVPAQEDIFNICLQLFEQAKKEIYSGEIKGGFVFQHIKIFWDFSGTFPVYGYSFEYQDKDTIYN